MKRRFKHFFEATDIFGFHRQVNKDEIHPDDQDEKPMRCFNTELMMDFLTKKSVGIYEPVVKFMNEVQWGDQPGAVKLEIDPGYTFYIKKWGVDKKGENRWVTKKMFQLNRTGYGGYEDTVAAEIHDNIINVYEGQLDSPKDEYKALEKLVLEIADKIRRSARPIFLYRGIKRVDDDNYLIRMEVRAQGLEHSHQRRVEENQTQVSYDKEHGVIRVTNYNIESSVGGPHSWQLMPVDLDLHFFPTQSRDEISECVAVHVKYY